MVRLSAGGKLRCFQSGGVGGASYATPLPDGNHLLNIQMGGRGRVFKFRKLHIQLHLKNAVQ